jgi:hypothetical protein
MSGATLTPATTASARRCVPSARTAPRARPALHSIRSTGQAQRRVPPATSSRRTSASVMRDAPPRGNAPPTMWPSRWRNKLNAALPGASGARSECTAEPPSQAAGSSSPRTRCPNVAADPAISRASSIPDRRRRTASASAGATGGSVDSATLRTNRS